jgi:esterase/lipase superfamily enzyme
MISNRVVKGQGFGGDLGPVQYWVSASGPLDNFRNWQNVSADDFKTALIKAAGRFPAPVDGGNADQSHVCFFVHGYNVGWQDAARRYEKVCGQLFSGPEGLGLCVCFDWPSLGHPWDYLPDRSHARQCALDLANVLSELYDWLLQKQADATEDSADACRAKVSLIAHSMGNYLLQKAMAAAWTRKNQPLLVSLINQLIMVAADVDNDLYDPDSHDAADGNAVANLTYRITALFSGRDEVLGASAGLKHFGSRRLGRSGLSTRPPSGKDNVWDVDCSGFFPATIGGGAIHSAYFEVAETIELIREILKGTDRGVLATKGSLKGTAWP